jgi:hypothetical protein
MGEGDNIAFQISSYYEPFEISELRATQKQPPSNTQSGTADCTTATVDPTDGDPAYDCPESVGPDGLTIFGGEGPQPWAAGTPVTISLNGTKPPNTLIPTVHVRHMPDCTDAAFGDGETTCADTVAVPVYGAYHRVVLNVTNRIVEEPIPDVKYELCGPTPNEGPLPTPTPTTTNTDLPPTGNASAPCPNNGEVLATGTSDENGNVDFGLFPGSEQYSAVPTHVPHGYFKGDFVEINVPQVTKAAEAGTTITQDTTLMPKPPKLQDQSVSTPENQSVTLNALEGATAVTNPLRLTGVGTPGHGTAHDPQGDVTYTPDEGYVGKDAFTYTATNGLGRSATATVHVTVTPVPKRHPTPGPSSGPGTKPHRGSAGGTSSAGAAAGTSTVSEPSGALPFTGENATRDGAVGLLALATGSLLVVTGRRRRRAGR